MDFQSWDNGFEQSPVTPHHRRKKNNHILIIVLLLAFVLLVVVLAGGGHPKPIVAAWDGFLYLEENANVFSLSVAEPAMPDQYGAMLLSENGELLQWVRPDVVSTEEGYHILYFSTLRSGADGLVVPVAYRQSEHQLLVGEPIKVRTASQAVPAQTAAPQDGPTIQLAVSRPDGRNTDGLQLTMHLTDLEPEEMYNAGFMLAYQGGNPQQTGERCYAWGVSDAKFTADVTLPAQDVAKDHILIAYVYVQSTKEMFFSEPLLFVPDQIKPIAPTVTPTLSSTPTSTATCTPTVTARPACTPTFKPTLVPTVPMTPNPVPSTLTPTPIPKPTPTPKRRSPVPEAELFSIYDQATRYYYLQLNSREKSCFADIYDAVCARDETITFAEFCTRDELLRVLDVLTFDCPELFDCVKVSSYNSRLGMVVGCDMEYSLSVAEHENAIDRMLEIFDRIATGKKGDYEKEIALYTHIQRNTVYDTKAATAANAIGLFLEGRAKCAGYAQGAMLALRCMGIPCASVTGFTYEDDGSLADIGHEWLIVQIEGKWYHCDPTWDDSEENEEIDDAGLLVLPYTNITDAMLANGRLINNFGWHSVGFTQPKCISTDANYYKRNGRFIPKGGDATAAFEHALVEASNAERKGFALFFESQQEYERFLADDRLSDISAYNADGKCVYPSSWWYYDIGLIYVDQIGEY